MRRAKHSGLRTHRLPYLRLGLLLLSFKFNHGFYLPRLLAQARFLTARHPRRPQRSLSGRTIASCVPAMRSLDWTRPRSLYQPVPRRLATVSRRLTAIPSSGLTSIPSNCLPAVSRSAFSTYRWLPSNRSRKPRWRWYPSAAVRALLLLIIHEVRTAPAGDVLHAAPPPYRMPHFLRVFVVFGSANASV